MSDATRQHYRIATGVKALAKGGAVKAGQSKPMAGGRAAPRGKKKGC